MSEYDHLSEEGQKLAVKHQWNGLDILRICEAALTDASFHHEAEIVDEMIRALENGDQPAFRLLVIRPTHITDDDTASDDTVPF